MSHSPNGEKSEPFRALCKTNEISLMPISFLEQEMIYKALDQ